jgi:N-acyl-D-aspartate/D-glutamate deacylase
MRRMPTWMSVLPIAFACGLAGAGPGAAPSPAAAQTSAPTAPTAAPAAPAPPFDLVIRNGTVYDGTGAPGQRADVAIRGDRVAAVGALGGARAARSMDATGMAVAPGFINMLSWAPDAFMVDGRSMSDIKQGVTLEIFGEGTSMGPYDDWMKADAKSLQGDIKYDITWSTLGEWLDLVVGRGVTPNIASFVGATTLREHELRYADRAPTPAELARMQELARQAMDEGALGIGGSLIYAPAFYAKTPELVALARAAGESGGGFVAHIRSEGNRFLEAVDELISVARDAGVHGEIYHLKAAGQANWPKMAQAISRIDAARATGLSVSANMYVYTAGATGLDAAMPPWVQEGGLDAWVDRLRDPATRAGVLKEMRTPSDAWENLAMAAGAPERIRFIGFKNPALKPLTGMNLAQVAAKRGTSPEDTMIDLVIEDHSRVDTAYFIMSEDNVRLGIRQPWVAFGSDAESSAPEGVFLLSSTHPRAYGNVARLLGHYVRDEKLITLEDAVRRLTRLPARNWKLRDRGCLDAGCYADLVVFDPARIEDHSTFDKPQQYATGVRDVFVNGVQVLKDGEHTGALPGRVVRGPGWCGWRDGGCGSTGGSATAGTSAAPGGGAAGGVSASRSSTGGPRPSR